MKRKRTCDDDSNATRPAKRVYGHTIPLSERKHQVETWRTDSKTAFKDRASMTTFPEPPAWTCYNSACRNGKADDRALKACECNIRAAYEGMETKQLKKERREWHPDRFGVCREDKRQVWQRMATEVFTAVSSMLRVF